MVEVLSSGEGNIKRDKETKLNLYSLHGVEEYWIVSWQLKTIECYRRRNDQLQQLQWVETLSATDILSSPLLPGFRVEMARVFLEELSWRSMGFAIKE